MNETKKEIKYLRLDEIIPNRFQPRLTFNEEELKALSDSIKMHGIIEPLVVRRLNDKYEIIAGERRYKASQMAGLTEVPCIVVDMDDNESAEVALIENLQRQNLTSLEEAQSFKKILDMGYTQEELAKRMGVSQGSIANKLRLLNLTIPVKEALLNNRISERHARSLLKISDSLMQINMLNRIMNERLTVRQTDEEINKMIGSDSAPMNENIEVNVDILKAGAEDIIKPKPFNNIDKLLESEPVKKEETPNSFNTTSNLAINPFQEIEPEIIDFGFEINNEEENAVKETENVIDEPVTFETPLSEETDGDSTGSKPITKAINEARNQVKKLEELGYEIETEEFDFNDMYQIIIKIKK